MFAWGPGCWGRATETNPNLSGVREGQGSGVSHHHSLVSAQVRGGESLTLDKEGLFLGTEMSPQLEQGPVPKP